MSCSDAKKINKKTSEKSFCYLHTDIKNQRMNLKNGDITKKQPKKSHKNAKIKEPIKNKINHKDNSAHCLFKLQCMMGAKDEFLLPTTCFFDGHRWTVGQKCVHDTLKSQSTALIFLQSNL